MSKICLLILLAITAVACTIDPLPPRPGQDGATDMGGAGGVDAFSATGGRRGTDAALGAGGGIGTDGGAAVADARIAPGDMAGTSQILPPDYQTSYFKVRGCRLANGHGSNSIVVFANAQAQSDYSSGIGPLPQGSVIVAVESDQADCSSLVGYTLMFKEAPGYNSTAGDWHWQRLDDQRDVLEDGRVQSCISCHTQCNRDDYTYSPP